MKTKTKKILSWVMCLVFIFTIIPLNTPGQSNAEDDITYDYTWMDSYSDEEFTEISGMSKEEWKEEYPDLTFADFEGVQTYELGKDVTYTFYFNNSDGSQTGYDVYCDAEPTTAVGHFVNTGELIICCDQTNASPLG